MLSPKKLYRLGVGMMVVNSQKKIFVGRRIHSVNNDYSWQMPQGGINLNEDIVSAAKRELSEETSISNVELIAITPNWLKYDLPTDLKARIWNGKFTGQKQKWCLMKFIGNDQEININTDCAEFAEWKWEDIENLDKLIVPFKVNLYQTVINLFKPILLRI